MFKPTKSATALINGDAQTWAQGRPSRSTGQAFSQCSAGHALLAMLAALRVGSALAKTRRN
jgi:hypothetical protein